MFFLWRRRRPEHTFWRKVFGSCRRRQRAEKKKEENIWSAEEKKNREEKGGNYLVFGGEKETRWERRKLLEEGKILVTSIDQPPSLKIEARVLQVWRASQMSKERLCLHEKIGVSLLDWMGGRHCDVVSCVTALLANWRLGRAESKALMEYSML